MIDEPQHESEGRGRSKKKKAAQAVEALAVRMVEANEALSKSLPLPDEIRNELDQARKITARSARKRQIKRLAGVLRRDEESVAAIHGAFDAVGRRSRAEKDIFHHFEELRDALCDPNLFAEAIKGASAEFPNLDRQKFSRLAKRVHTNGDKRASREIFRRLRALAAPTSE